MENQEKPAGNSKSSSSDILSGINITAEKIQRFLDAGKVEAVYGNPVQKGDVMIIPTSENISALGFGWGFGGDEEEKEKKDKPSASGFGGGAGGGGSVHSRPVAIITITANSVKVEPVIDLTKIYIAAFTAVGFMMSMIANMKKGPKNSKQI